MIADASRVVPILGPRPDPGLVSELSFFLLKFLFLVREVILLIFIKF